MDKIEFYKKAIINFTYFALGLGYKISDIDDIFNLADNDELKENFIVLFEGEPAEVIKEINELVKSTKRDLAFEFNEKILYFLKDYNEVKAEEIIYNRYIPKDSSENIAKDNLKNDLDKKYAKLISRYNLE